MLNSNSVFALFCKKWSCFGSQGGLQCVNIQLPIYHCGSVDALKTCLYYVLYDWPILVHLPRSDLHILYMALLFIVLIKHIIRIKIKFKDSYNTEKLFSIFEMYLANIVLYRIVYTHTVKSKMFQCCTETF